VGSYQGDTIGKNVKPQTRITKQQNTHIKTFMVKDTHTHTHYHSKVWGQCDFKKYFYSECIAQK